LIDVDRDFDVDEFKDAGAEPALDRLPSPDGDFASFWDNVDGDGGLRASAW
jgi:hypothetical protein